MSKVYLSNAFSLNMLKQLPVSILVRSVDLKEVKTILTQYGFESCIGHSATAEVLSKLLEIDVPMSRSTIKLEPGDTLIVFQLTIRLQEGQVLNKDEILDLYSQGQASFMLVNVEQPTDDLTSTKNHAII